MEKTYRNTAAILDAVAFSELHISSHLEIHNSLLKKIEISNCNLTLSFSVLIQIIQIIQINHNALIPYKRSTQVD